jgi:hypothetical protein
VTTLTDRARRATASIAGVAATVVLAGCAGHHTTPNSAAPDPNRPPSGVHWETFQGISLPIGDDGPAHDDGTATGYTHTPQGAVLAAVNHMVRMSTADDTTWPSIAATELAPGPGKDAYVLARVRISITGPAQPTTTPRIVGYRITAYSPTAAQVAIVASYPEHSLTSTDTRVVWTGGDWRLELPDPATKTRTVTAVNTLPANMIRLETTS